MAIEIFIYYTWAPCTDINRCMLLTTTFEPSEYNVSQCYIGKILGELFVGLAILAALL